MLKKGGRDIKLVNWIADFLKQGEIKKLSHDCLVWEAQTEVALRELAFWSCVNLVASALAKCEFRTYSSGEEVREKNYYLWNISPNRNQNKGMFLRQLVAALYRENEVLVIEQDGQFLVADSFSRKPYALYDDVFTEVQAAGFQFNRSFVQSEVLYFQLSFQDMSPLILGFSRAWERLLSCGMNGYRKSRGIKGVMEIDTMAAGGKEFAEKYDAIRNESFRTWAQAENGLLPLWKGMKYTEIGNKTYSSEGTRDLRNMADDIFHFTASGLGIPPALISKELEGTEAAVDQFLTFGLDPLAEMIQTEINRKTFGYEGFKREDRIQIDTRTVKHRDLLDGAAALDKLIASGGFSINEIRRAVGVPPILEEWADLHYMTKNYQPIEAAVAEGGEPI